MAAGESVTRQQQVDTERILEFTCNLCEGSNRFRREDIGRENPSCSFCGSTVRVRGFLRMLSLELFGTNLTLPAFPRVKSLRGIGISDTAPYASILAEKFDYRNTFYDHAPRFDVANPPDCELNGYDFVTSSEVFEHVPPPIEAAFSNVLRLLKPNGVLLLTVPYSIEDASLEHFSDLYEYAIARVGESNVLVNRTRSGLVQVFENLVFHLGSGAALEMREMNERHLMALLTGVGFSEVHVHGESFERFGVLYPETWSLPIAARRGPYALGKEPAREILDQFAELRAQSAELKARVAAAEAQGRRQRSLRRAMGLWSRRRPHD